MFSSEYLDLQKQQSTSSQQVEESAPPDNAGPLNLLLNVRALLVIEQGRRPFDSLLEKLDQQAGKRAPGLLHILEECSAQEATSANCIQVSPCTLLGRVTNPIRLSRNAAKIETGWK